MGESPPSPVLTVDDDGIATIRFDDPGRSVNVLTEDVMRRLAGLIEGLRPRVSAGEVRGVVFRSGKPDHFIAGADVTAIQAIEDPEAGELASRFGQTVFMAVEELDVPSLAAISGTCLGGGLELSLACTWRVASDHPATRLGLPEVRLGILPAWGGTTRLPRLIGLRAALDLILSGRKIDAGGAKRRGLVDEVLPVAGFEAVTQRWLIDRMRSGSGTRRRKSLFARLLEDTLPGMRIVLSSARKSVMKQTGGHYPAPLQILDVVSKSAGRPLRRALELEARAAGGLIASAVSKHLLHVFTLQERAKRPPVGPSALPGAPVERISVIGAGVMGGGIAQLAADRGVSVRLKDIRHEAVSSGLAHADEVFRRAVGKRRRTEDDHRRGMARISGTLDYSGFANAQLVIEAVVERLDVKRAVLSEVEGEVDDMCVLATNTSSLRVDALASALERPERFAGLHFFNPVDRMPLVEIVRGSVTDDPTIGALHRFVRAVGKVPVVVGDGPGFVVNRVLGPYLNEAGYLLGDGVSGRGIDAAALEFGMPMGPLRLIDEIGLDIAGHAGQALHEAFGDRLTPAPALAAVAETGRLGRKSGSGFYRHGGGGGEVFDPEVQRLLSGPSGPAKPQPEARSITRRLILAMVNEAARVLEDGVAASAADLDLAMVMGTGFPPFRGGLLRFADGLHPRAVEQGLDELAAIHGVRFEPAAVIRDLVATGRGFYDRFPEAP